MKDVLRNARTLLLFAAVLAATGGNANAAAILYVTNFGSNTITSYDASTGSSVGTVTVDDTKAAGLNGIRVTPGGTLVVGAQFTNNVVEYSPTGTFVKEFDPGNTAGLESTQGLTFGPDGNLYVVSSQNDKILKYDPATGQFLGVFATLGVPAHDGPIDVAFGPNGNLYVTTFDSGRVIEVNGQTGAIVQATPGPAGIAFAAEAFGPGGFLYLIGVDPASFLGGVYRFDPTLMTFSPFIAQGTGGLDAPGGLVFDPGGNLLVSNLLVDENFADIGSTILKFNGQSGAPLGTLVAAGQGLSIPFGLTLADVPEPVAEPGSMTLLALGAGVVFRRIRQGGDRG